MDSRQKSQPDQHSKARLRLAALQGRRLARSLVGLAPREALGLARMFITTFLDELFHREEVDAGSLIELAQIPLDIVLKRQAAPKPAKTWAS